MIIVAEPISVLICDDVAAMRSLLRIVVELEPRLRVAGEAGTGDDAVLQAQTLQPDVILLDLSMPRRTGLDALPAIRLVAPTSVVIAFSGLDELVVGDAARAAGAALFLQKGAKPAAIVAAIVAAHLNGRGNGRVVAENGDSPTGEDAQSAQPLQSG